MVNGHIIDGTGVNGLSREQQDEKVFLVSPLCSGLPLCTIVICHTTLEGIIYQERNESGAPMLRCTLTYLNHWVKDGMYNDLD